MTTRPMLRHANVRRRRSRGAGFSLMEVLVATTIFGLAMTAITRQLIESVQLSLKTAQTLEYSRNSRYVVDALRSVINEAQSVTVYTDFTDRTPATAAGYGNYVVAHTINTAGTVVRTVGYYLKVHANGTSYTLYCHDSNTDGPAAGELPVASSAGSHRMLVRTVRIPAGSGIKLFRNWRDLGFSLRGQFGQAEPTNGSNLEYIQSTFTTRS